VERLAFAARDERKTIMVADTISTAERPGQQHAIVSLPDVPDDIYGVGREYQKARQWEIIWEWCVKHGLATHSYEHTDQYDNLKGPQMIAQWIIDMKSALYFCEQCIGTSECNDETT